MAVASSGSESAPFRIITRRADEVDVTADDIRAAIRDLTVAESAYAVQKAAFYLQAGCMPRSPLSLMDIMKAGAGKALASALRRHATDCASANLLLTVTRELVQPLEAVPLFVGDGIVPCVVTVLRNPGASADLQAGACGVLDAIAREEVGTRAVLAADGHKAAIASLRRFGSTNADLVLTVCGMFASMCIYSEGAAASFLQMC